MIKSKVIYLLVMILSVLFILQVYNSLSEQSISNLFAPSDSYYNSISHLQLLLIMALLKAFCLTCNMRPAGELVERFNGLEVSKLRNRLTDRKY